VTVAAGTHLDERTASFVDDVVAAVDDEVPVVEAFVLGSGAAGGFDPATSDVDLVVVVAEPLGDRRDAIVRRVAALDVPVRDLELVVYVEGRQPPDFELNLNHGQQKPHKPGFWFVIDAALAQEHAVPIRGGPEWDELFEPVSPERLEGALRESLRWADERDDEFARVHAERVRGYLERGEWTTKKEAGR
jgi:Nucleotidyltransferase domain